MVFSLKTSSKTTGFRSGFRRFPKGFLRFPRFPATFPCVSKSTERKKVGFASDILTNQLVSALPRQCRSSSNFRVVPGQTTFALAPTLKGRRIDIEGRADIEGACSTFLRFILTRVVRFKTFSFDWEVMGHVTEGGTADPRSSHCSRRHSARPVRFKTCSFDWELRGTSPRAELQIRAAVIALAGAPRGTLSLATHHSKQFSVKFEACTGWRARANRSIHRHVVVNV